MRHLPRLAADVTPTPEYEAARDWLHDGAGHLFVTGRAGTGKRRCSKPCVLLPDEAVVLAPTGLAAVNVGGQTIHSFFGLPPRLIRPEDIRRSRNGAVMRRLKFLVVDEVSMVRADLMWAIDQALRVNRGAHASPSAACGLILFGDLHQLPRSCRRPRSPRTWRASSAARSSSRCLRFARPRVRRCSS